MNFLVKKYLRRFDKELLRMKMEPNILQECVIDEVLSSRHTKHFWGEQIAGFEGDLDRFKREMPLSTYDNYRQGVIELMNPSCKLSTEYFSRSSGTSSSLRKLIPTTERFVRVNHLRATWYILHTLFKHRPDISVFNRKNLLVGGSIYDRKTSYMVGDVSGIMLYRIPFFFRPYCLPDIPTAILSDWSAKIQRTAAIAARTKRVSMVAGTPTWVLAVIKEMLRLTDEKDINRIWPEIECIVHGGISIAPYRDQFETIFNSSDLSFLETYNASEGFFGFQNDLGDPSLLLMISNGIFYEFVPFDQYKRGSNEAVSLWEVQLDKPYVLVISTISGLLRYVVGDVVRFTSLHPYKMVITGRITDYINAFGEDLLLNQAEDAITQAAALFDTRVVQYTIAPSYLSMEAKGYHEWYIEFEKSPEHVDQFEECLDSLLRRLNPNYDQKRHGNFAMERLHVNVVPPRGFEAYLRSKNCLHGQAKIPRLRNDRQLAEDLNHLINKKVIANERSGTLDYWTDVERP